MSSIVTPGWAPWVPNRRQNESSIYRAARYLAHHMPDVPAMILVCADHTLGSAPYTPGQPIERGRYASSIWLAVQNLFLAALRTGFGNASDHGVPAPGRRH